MKGEVLIFLSSVCQRMLKDGLRICSENEEVAWNLRIVEFRTALGKKERLKINKKRGVSAIQTSQVYNNQESI